MEFFEEIVLDLILIKKRRVVNKKVHLGSPWNAALTFKKKY